MSSSRTPEVPTSDAYRSTADPAVPPDSFPLAVAAIDVGTNAIRYVAAEFSTPTEYRVVQEERVPVRLGHDVFLTGRLAAGAMDAAVAALGRLLRSSREVPVRAYRAVATSAVREAANGAEFVARVREESGVELEVITGSEEARLVHVAVRSRIPLGSGRWVLVDLGGGSVEVSLVDAQGIQWSESHTMGSVRLLEELSVAGTEPGRFRQLLEEYAATLTIPRAGRQWQFDGLIATGGSIETLAKLAGSVPAGDAVGVLTVRALRALIETLSRLSYRQRIEELNLREDRADVILPAALVYERVATLTAVETIRVPHVGVKEGILLDVVDNLVLHRSHADRLDEEAYQGALILGRRYMFDEAHGVHVARLALELFDQLASLHGLGPNDRRVLRAAAVLHDIGQYVSPKKHHKHSHYLIANSEVAGFSPAEIERVALVARYHRKGEPAPHHTEFMALPEADRERVVRLAALLRVAAALDREHRQRVQGLRVRTAATHVSLQLGGAGEYLLERWALQRNKGLFEQTFGRELRLADSIT